MGTMKAAELAALQCLAYNKISELPVSLTTIARNSSVKIIKNSDANELQPDESGISLLIGTEYFIVYDDVQSKERCRFTIAHELGHIFLGHLSTNIKEARAAVSKRRIIEQEADLFASRLLAPACVLWGLGLKTPAQISKFCGLSYTASKISCYQMQPIYKRNEYTMCDLEREVYGDFKEFIDKNKTRSVK